MLLIIYKSKHLLQQIQNQVIMSYRSYSTLVKTNVMNLRNRCLLKGGKAFLGANHELLRPTIPRFQSSIPTFRQHYSARSNAELALRGPIYTILSSKPILLYDRKLLPEGFHGEVIFIQKLFHLLQTHRCVCKSARSVEITIAFTENKDQMPVTGNKDYAYFNII